MTEKELKLPPLNIGRPVFIKPRIDVEKNKEEMEKERLEMLCKAFEDVPREPVLCRCYIEKRDDLE